MGFLRRSHKNVLPCKSICDMTCSLAGLILFCEKLFFLSPTNMNIHIITSMSLGFGSRGEDFHRLINNCPILEPLHLCKFETTFLGYYQLRWVKFIPVVLQKKYLKKCLWTDRDGQTDVIRRIVSELRRAKILIN